VSGLLGAPGAFVLGALVLGVLVLGVLVLGVLVLGVLVLGVLVLGAPGWVLCASGALGAACARASAGAPQHAAATLMAAINLRIGNLFPRSLAANNDATWLINMREVEAALN